MQTQNLDYVFGYEVCKTLGIHGCTLRRWYQWWENPHFEKPEDLYLPPYRYLGNSCLKIFRKEDVEHLRVFHEKLTTTHRGALAEFNAAKVWGKRADSILKKKGLDADHERMKLYKNYEED